jgi:alkylhydroperoxidase family enzyme
MILRLAYIWNSEYELFHHLAIARNLGLTEEKIAALESGEFAALDDQERAIAQFATEVWHDVSPSDKTLAAVRAFLPDSTIFEMIPVMASYFITARVVAIGGVEIDGEPVGVWPAKAWRKPGEVD